VHFRNHRSGYAIKKRHVKISSSMSSSRARFHVGQLIVHLKWTYRGVVFDVDPIFMGTEEWYRDVALSRPPRDRAQDVKAVVDELKLRGRGEAVLHPRVYRPWGFYQTVHEGDRFQVKRITVNRGASLSLQMHHHRAEHWVVVNRAALVRNGDREFTLNENESTYIPPAVLHRLSNPGKVPLHLIEVQSGSYLGEDDIVRYDDDYGRD